MPFTSVSPRVDPTLIKGAVANVTPVRCRVGAGGQSSIANTAGTTHMINSTVT
jgi:hypothetical protein